MWTCNARPPRAVWCACLKNPNLSFYLSYYTFLSTIRSQNTANLARSRARVKLLEAAHEQ